MPVFLAPIYLLAAAAAVVPLALHLWWRRKPRPVPFSTLRFLEDAVARTRRSSRLTHLLVLLLRLLAVLLVAAAFARPKLPARAGAATAGHRQVWLVVDSSASMQVHVPGGTGFAVARDWALDLVHGLRPGDKAALLLPGLSEPRAVFPPVTAHDRLSAVLAAAKAGFAGTDLVRFLADTLEHHPDAVGLGGLEIHVFSDFQTVAWPNRGAAADTLAHWLKARDARLFLNRVQPAAVSNAGIIQGTTVWTAGGDLEAAATLRATPDFAGPAAVTLLLDGREQERRAVPLAPGRTDQVSLRGRPDGGTGVATPGRLELTDDLFLLDNVWYLAAPRPEGVRVRVVGEGEPERSGALFVRAALAAGDRRGPGFTVEQQSWERFAAGTPDDVRLVVVCAPPPLPPDSPAVRRLAGVLAAGGTVVLFPGADSAWAAQPPALLGLDGLSVKEWRADDAHPATPLALLPAEGATVAGLEKRVASTLATAPQITARRHLVFAASPAGAAPAFAWPDGTPFLLEISAGPGRLWLGSLPADRDSSDWPLTPFFVILQQELARGGAGRLAKPLAALVGGGAAVEWPGTAGTAADFTLRDPTGATRRLALKRPAATDPFWVTGFFNQPGIWRLSQGRQERLIAVNVDPVETDLAYVPADRLAVLPGDANVTTAGIPRELQDQLARASRGRPLWPFLLAAALVVAVLESLVANAWLWRLERARP